MSLLDEIRAALQGWQEWRAIRDAPGQIASLEARLSKLEQRLSAIPAGRETNRRERLALVGFVRMTERSTRTLPNEIVGDLMPEPERSG